MAGFFITGAVVVAAACTAVDGPPMIFMAVDGPNLSFDILVRGFLMIFFMASAGAADAAFFMTSFMADAGDEAATPQ